MKKIILSIIALSALASCQKSTVQNLGVSDSTEVSGSTEVSFTSGISTRVSGTMWEADDQIGVFMYEVDDDALYDDYGSNVLYNISSGAGSESAKFSSDNPLYFPQGASMDFVAYYPYTDLSSTTISINTADQSSAEKLETLDFMVARAANCADKTSPTLSFARKMSKIVFEVSRKDNAVGETLDFTLSNVVSDGTYAIVNSSAETLTKVTAGTTKGDISLFENDDEQVETIIVPQSATDAKIAVSFLDYTYTGTFSETFEAGMEYTYTLYVGQNEVVVGEVTIKNWDGSVDLGDLKLEGSTYTASEIDADNVPNGNNWTITDEGTLTLELMAGVVAALNVAKEEGRSVKITLPNATSIGYSAFDFREGDEGIYDGVSALVDIEMPNVTAIESWAFAYCGFTSFDFEGVTEIGESVFSSCENLAEVINFNYTAIPTDLFWGCGFTSFDFEGITEIGESVFSNCKNLTEVINFNYTTIPFCFFSNSDLTSFDFTGVEVIGYGAFAHCSLTEIELPSTVTEIRDMAFFYSYVSTVTLNWVGDQILTYVSSWFEYSPVTTIYIPAGTTADYVAKGWDENLLTEKN